MHTIPSSSAIMSSSLLLQRLLLGLTIVLCTMVGPARQQWDIDNLKDVRCPTYIEGNSRCECTANPDGLDFRCDNPSMTDIRAVLSASRFAVKTIAAKNLDPNVTILPEKIFKNGSVLELQIDGSALQDMKENAFEGTTTRLQTLTLHNGKLTSVPRAVGKISSLKRLSLQSNRIQDIYAYAFFSQSKLSYLNLKDNKLETMAENAFLGLENNLRELVLENNQFRLFPLSAVKILKKLHSLNLSKNSVRNITTDSFTRLDSIIYLDMSDNMFDKINRDTLMSLPKLKRLSFASNMIHEVESGSFDGLKDLESLDLKHNRLTILPSYIFSQTRRLTQVDLSNNRLRTLSGVFLDLSALEEVFLNDNLLLQLTNDWFHNTPNLHAIHLQNNVIFEIEENALQPLKRLSRLTLSSNFLNEITANNFRYNQAMTSLSLDNNHIGTIDPVAFRGIPKLRKLRLQNNVLRTIKRQMFASLTSLTELDLENNRISSIEAQSFSGLANLRQLNLMGNKLPKLEDIMMRYPSTLNAMYLDHNKLVSFHTETFSGQTTVEILSMSDNRLERIPANVFAELINLYRLSLASNRISVIEDNALVGLHQVRYLDLSNNRLTRLTNATLGGLQQAERVDLSNNRLAIINTNAFTGFHHLKELDMSNNKIKVLNNGAFRGCLTVRVLRLANAGIKSIEPNALDDFVALEELDIRNNELAIPSCLYPLNKLGALRTLSLSGNDMTNIAMLKEIEDKEMRRSYDTSYTNQMDDGGVSLYTSTTPVSYPSLKGLADLQQLELENCNLTHVRGELFGDNTKLKLIKLGGNNLTFLTEGLFARQVFLEELHLDRNNFSEPPNAAMKYLFNLVKLNMSGNSILDLNDSSFDHVGGLRVLDLSNNGMKGISERAFHNVTKLKMLNIGMNKLENFFMNTFLSLLQLETLIASDNLLPNIGVAVQGLRTIRVLKLSGNPMLRLKELPDSRGEMKTVKKVKITNSELSVISKNDFSMFPNIKELTLSQNKLARIAKRAFERLGRLTMLDLSKNNVIHLSRERLLGMKSLKMLNLSHNLLGSLDVFPIEMQQLLILDLSHNRIRSISRDTLRHLSNLVRLDLKGNLLGQILPEVLRPLEAIKALNLAHNTFSSLPVDSIKTVEYTLQTINLEGNPLICSCQSYAQKLWLRRHRKWLDNEKRGSKVGPQCQEPTPILNRYLLSVKDSDLCPLPSVNSLQLSEIEPTSFLVTWDSPDTNMTGLRGFIVAYHRTDRNDQVTKYRLSPSIRGFHVVQISDDSSYRICVVTRGSSYKRTSSSNHQNSINLLNASNTPFFTSNSKRDRKKFSGKKKAENNVIDADDYDIDEGEAEDVTLSQLVLLRKERSSNEENERNSNKVLIDEGGSIMVSDQIVFTNTLTTTEVIDEVSNDTQYLEIPVYPSSNDTGLIVLKPAIVNLGSQSSKCTEIHTPMDPSKMSLVDNKRMSVIIGCVSGLVVFTCIIMSIVTRPKFKEEDESSAPADSLSGSARKSPSGSKHPPDTRSDSLHFSVPEGARHSRSDSHSSSIANRINVVGDVGSIMGGGTNQRTVVGDRSERSVMKDHPHSGSGTLRRGQLSRQPTDDSSGPHHNSGNGGVSHHPLQPPNPGIIKQSSTDSGHSTSHRSSDVAAMGLHNSRQRRHVNEVNRLGNREQPPGGQSWHGTPRTDSNRRGVKPGRQGISSISDNQSRTLPRRGGATSGDLQHRIQQESGGSSSLDGTLIKRRSAAPGGGGNYGEDSYQNNTSIPLIEFHLVNGSPNNAPGMRGETLSSNVVPSTHPNENDPLDENDTNEDVFYHQSNRDTIINHKGNQRSIRGQQTQQSNNPNNKNYIKYNSFANY